MAKGWGRGIYVAKGWGGDVDGRGLGKRCRWQRAGEEV